MLPAEAHLFTVELKDALLRMENNRRRESKLVPYPPDIRIDIPEGARSTLRLLNLKVWSLRYCVPLEFILDTITWIFRRKRVENRKTLVLGLPANLATCPTARIYLEEAILRAFPNGENYLAAQQPVIPPPDIEMLYEGTEDFVEKYNLAMESRQRIAFRRPQYHRNFRRLK